MGTGPIQTAAEFAAAVDARFGPIAPVVKSAQRLLDGNFALARELAWLAKGRPGRRSFAKQRLAGRPSSGAEAMLAV
jgi:hypothetical protein